MASSIITDAFKLFEFGKTGYQGQVDLDSDAIYILLVNATGAAIADATKRGYVYESDINANEVGASGSYATRGAALSGLSLTISGNVMTFTATNPAFTSATISSGGCWILSHKSTAGTSPLLYYLDFGATVVSTAGTFTVSFNGSTGIMQASGG